MVNFKNEKEKIKRDPARLLPQKYVGKHRNKRTCGPTDDRCKERKKKKTKETRKIKMEGTRTDLRDLREWNGAEKM